MRLYSGSSKEFIHDSTHNRIAELLKTAFRGQFRYDAPKSEVNAWRNSLRSLAQVFTEAGLDDHGVMLEYQLPLTSKRLDCLVTGRDGQHAGSAIVIELKQWDECEASEGDDLVQSFVGGAVRHLLHPSAQANQYRRHLADMHEAFHGDDAVHLRYSAVCPICAGTLELRYSQSPNTRALVGCCNEAPHDHVFSFDRIGRTGSRILDGSLENADHQVMNP